ncbi:hypothetical protein V8C86DRAFT_2557342 [Haematococcus lacustris]
MTSAPAPVTIALLVLGAAIFFAGRLEQAIAASTPLPDPSANTTVSDATSSNSDTVIDTITLLPFIELRSCVPFTVLIAAPTNASTDDVYNKIDVTLLDGVLALSILGDFETNNGIKCTITLGNSSSLSGVHNSGTGNLIVGPGFRAKNFTVASTAVGNTFVFGLNTSTAHVFSMGSSTVLLNGSVSDGGSLEVGGTSKVYLTGAIGGTLEVNLGGISTTYVQGLPGTAIQGSVEGLAKVLFTARTCSVQSPFQSILGSPFGDPCRKVQAGGPLFVFPSWSCGLRVEGRSTCTSDEAVSSPLAPVSVDLGIPATSYAMSVVRLRCLDPSHLDLDFL